MAFRYLFILSFAAMLLGGCVEGIDDEATGTAGGDALVKIAFEASGLKPVESRSLSEDQEKELHNLHVLIFDADGRVVTNRHYSNVTDGKVDVETYAGDNRTLFVLANDSGQKGDDREDVTYSQALLQITSRSQLDALLAELSNPNDQFDRQRGLMSVGQLSSVNIRQGSSNSVGPVALHFVSARIDLTVVDATPSGASFKAYAWDVVNLPLQSYVVERTYVAGTNTDAVDPANSNHFATTSGEYAFTDGTNGNRTASFYMLENRRGGRVANPNTPPSGYSPGAIGLNSDKDKAWYAPPKATYVIVYGVYEKDGNSQMIKAYIYLGRNNHSDYNVYRGDKQQYTVTVKGMNDILVDSNVEQGQSSFSVSSSQSLAMDAHPDFCVFMITGIAEGGTPNYATVEILDAAGQSFGDAGFDAKWLKISPLNLYRHSVKQSSGEWQQFGAGQSSGSFVRPKYIPHQSYRQSNAGKKTALWDKITSDAANYPADDDVLPFDKATFRMCYKITDIPYTASAMASQQYITLYADEIPFGNTATRSATVRISFGRNAGVDEVRTFAVSQSGAAAVTGGVLEVETIEEATQLKSPGLDHTLQQTTQMQWGYNNQSLYANADRFSYGNYLTANAVYTGVTSSGTPKVPAWTEGDASIYRPKWPRSGTAVIAEPTATATLDAPYYYPNIVGSTVITGYFHPIFNASAARYCHEKNRDLNGDGKIDASETVWYLPSFADLRAIYNAGAGSSLAALPYWTSTEESTTNSWTINPSTGANASMAKTYTGRVRCVRGAGAPALAEASLTSNESDKSKLNLTSAAGGSKFNVTDASSSGFTWTVASSASSWLTISASATAAGAASQTGIGSNTGYYAYAPENTGDARSATLTLTRTASGSKTVTVTQAKSPYDKAFAGLLAVDASGKLNLDGSGKMAFFQFGSVVGFTQLGAWAADRVLFNPTTSAYASYGGIPVYASSDFSAGRKNVSANTYHTGANVKAGKGDPCKLVGLTAAQIQSMSAAQIEVYNSGWRMPTSEDQKTFTGQSANADYIGHWVTAAASPSGLAGGYFPKGQESQRKDFLPAAGYRNTSGSTLNVGSGGYYWSSEPYSSSNGYYLNFGDSCVSPLNLSSYANGFGVRCVKDEGPGALKVDANGILTVGGKMLFFKFGSVVGFTQEGAWAADKVLFNPTTTPNSTYATYAMIPVYADYPKNVTDATYHTGTNVKAGKGDPCRLVGLSASQIQSMSTSQLDTYNSGWRMPTSEDQKTFTGLSGNTSTNVHWTASEPQFDKWYYSTGSAGGWFPSKSNPQRYLPAAGYRTTSGSTTNVGSYGFYWSSEPYSTSVGYNLGFYDSYVYPLNDSSYAYGFGVRCVK